MNISELERGITRDDWRWRASGAAVTRRGRHHYRKVFDDTTDGKVLDLGPGRSRYAPPNSVRLDYIFGKKHPKKGINAAGIFQELPFADESFDHVTASYSLFWVKSGLELAIEEALRVLKPEGTLQIYPVVPANNANQELIELLETEGIVTRRINTMIGYSALAGAWIGEVANFAGELAFGESSMGVKVAAGVAGAASATALTLAGRQLMQTLAIHKEHMPSDVDLQESLVKGIVNTYDISHA